MTKAGSMRLSARTKAPSSKVSSNIVAACVRSVLFMSFQDFKASGRRRLSTVSTMACVQIKKNKKQIYLSNSGKQNCMQPYSVTQRQWKQFELNLNENENAVLKTNVTKNELKKLERHFCFIYLTRTITDMYRVYFWNYIDGEGENCKHPGATQVRFLFQGHCRRANTQCQCIEPIRFVWYHQKLFLIKNV